MILLSCEITTLVRVCSIIHLTIFLTSLLAIWKLHKLSRYNWSIRSMGQMVDLLKNALGLVQEDGVHILTENFMMGIFDKLVSKLPPLADYIQHMYESKRWL